MRLLVTRPEPDNARTAQALRAQGHDVMLAPLLTIEPIPNVPLGNGRWDAILLTSANGARAAAAHPRFAELKQRPVLAVGRGSAEAASAAGFARVTSADGDGADLVRRASAQFEPGARLLYFAGEDRARDLADELAASGIVVETVVAYRAIPATGLPSDARAALTGGAIDGVVHFSKRSVEVYLDCVRDLPAAVRGPMHYCLSERSAAPLRSAGATRVAVAARPDEAAMLSLVAVRRS